MTAPEGPPLTYRGLDRCDACGAPLEPEARLWGLCPACEAPAPPDSPTRQTPA